MIRNLLLVGLGGAIGAMMRYGVTLLCGAIQWSSNVATLLVNIIGSLAMGFLMGRCIQNPWMLLATVGICGGFTTFSTFSMQSVTLLQQGKYLLATGYILATVILCIAFAAMGYYVGTKTMRS